MSFWVCIFIDTYLGVLYYLMKLV